jgi:hypothetical protein
VIPKPNVQGNEPIEVIGVSTIQEALKNTIGNKG